MNDAFQQAILLAVRTASALLGNFIKTVIRRVCEDRYA